MAQVIKFIMCDVLDRKYKICDACQDKACSKFADESFTWRLGAETGACGYQAPALPTPSVHTLPFGLPTSFWKQVLSASPLHRVRRLSLSRTGTQSQVIQLQMQEGNHPLPLGPSL